MLKLKAFFYSFLTILGFISYVLFLKYASGKTILLAVFLIAFYGLYKAYHSFLQSREENRE